MQNLEYNILKIVSKYEKERRKKLKILIGISLLFWSMLATFFYVLSVSLYSGGFVYNSANPQFVLTCLIPGIVILVLGYIYVLKFFNNKFKLFLKKSCLKEVLAQMGNIKWQIGKKVISKTKCERSLLLPEFHDLKNDDTFTGEYKGVAYSISETVLLTRCYTHYGYTDNKIYNGVLINFASNKNIKAKTMVTTKGDTNIMNNTSLIPAIIILSIFISAAGDYWFLMLIVVLFVIGVLLLLSFSRQEKMESLDKIVLEDPVFNKKYTAYSNDEIEGRYLLTTGFMERYNNVRTAFGVNNIKCSFYDEDFMIAIKTKSDLFELGSLFTSLNNPKYIKKFMNEFTSILSLIDYFKLDKKIGM